MTLKLKILNYIFIPLILIFTLTFEIYGSGKVAVVKSRFDNIELVLDNYGIRYDLIEFKDLASNETFKKYDSIFFPSGIYSEYEDNIDVNWQGKDFTSVSLSKNFFEIDKDAFRSNFRKFTKAGGASYFSGYALKQLAIAYDYFDFFNDFPFMGIPGRIEADVRGDLARFSLKRKAAIYMEYPGWVALKHVSHAEVLSESSFMTPNGEKHGPISVIINDGGEILYTSYYSTVYSEFKRFNIYRIAGSQLKRKALDIVNNHSQSPTGIIIDSIMNKEAARIYYFNLKEGNNTIHFLSDDDFYMFEIYDRNMSLIALKDSHELSQNYNIISLKEDYCFIKIYPSGSGRYKMHAIISAHGTLIPPRITLAVKIIVGVLGSIFIFAFIRVLISRIF